jgi:elongation factor 4
MALPRFFFGVLQPPLRRVRCMSSVISRTPTANFEGLDIDAVGQVPIERIRNFCIIAHIDHGKSTLADRILELTGNIDKNNTNAQILDSLKVEQERGITVKAQTASMLYTDDENLEVYLLNLIDTPGHVDFSFEVSRSIAACQGALLLVDSTQGVQAQTLANYRIAKAAGLHIIPVLTKLDLPHSDPAMAIEQIEAAFQMKEEDVLWTSAKTGEGVDDILATIVTTVPSPIQTVASVDDLDGRLRAVVVDSWHNKYRGVVVLVSMIDGEMKIGDKIGMASTGKKYEVLEVGLLSPIPMPTASLKAGHVGYFIAGVKNPKDVITGDTIVTDAVLKSSTYHLVKKVKPSKPMLYASVYPTDGSEFENLSKSLDRLLLNDASVSVSLETSGALGQGFRCGFLGKLHMEVFFQRLQDEYESDVISTAPMVPFEAVLKNGKTVLVEKPSDLPERTKVLEYLEPMSLVTVVTPPEYIGVMMQTLQSHRGKQISMEHLDMATAVLKYQLPWQEVVIDLYDEIKNQSSGYASFDYEEGTPVAADIVRVDLLLNGSAVDALSFVCHRSVAESRGRGVALRLKNVINRQQYEVVIQAAIGSKVVARERIAPFRKDVLIKSGKTVGGGDVTRKKKLLEKQKKGKARMKMVGNVELNQEAFMSVMKR